MTERPNERTNEDWLTDLQPDNPRQPEALADLRAKVQRSIYYYLSQERSDLRDAPTQELQQMAEDLAQDTVMRVLNNLSYFRGESQFTTWANRIATRIAISELRRARYRDFSLDNLTAEGETLPAEASLISEAPPSPERAAERADTLGRVMALLSESLTDRQYKAIEAVALRGVPMDVVADQLGTNRNALYKLLHDARRKLKSALDADGLSVDYVLNLFQR
ncbi:MAG: sigma-70 family RNA polymerase sigma factor [Anaerolineae bacterium]|jgi:RNA polymerase sigma-70 factor (ECF subfamily)|nr:sigma-70 family RNA polymerase sigma factor [Anaerolineae bacterium]